MNEIDKISIGEIIESAWTKQKERLLYYAWVFAVYQVIAYFLGFFADKARPHLLTYVSFQFATMIILVIMQIGIVRFFLDSAEGKKPELGDIFESGDYFWRYLGAFVLVGLMALLVAAPASLLVFFLLTMETTFATVIAAIALSILIFLAIYLTLHFIFFPYLIVDQAAGSILALKESWKMSHGYLPSIMIFLLVLALINIAGALLLGIGLLVSMPLSQLALAILYRRLRTDVEKGEALLKV